MVPMPNQLHMSNNIHKTAIISEDVTLGNNVTIGPYAVIEGPVTIGDNVTVGAHVVIEGHTTIGRGCQFFSSAVIGAPPQDKKHHKDDKVFLTIGENNIFREFVTANPGTIDGGGTTTIGNNNLFMACAHIAHDCQVGSDCVMANYVGLSGHVTVEDRAIIGGLSGIHQFVRVGYMSIVGGCSKANQDVLPYSLVDGSPATLRGLNIVGLKRALMPTETQMALRRAFKTLFNEGLNRSHAVSIVKEQMSNIPEVVRVLEFIALSKRGIA